MNDDDNNNSNDNAFVGLELDGKVFYSARSTLTKTPGSYLARRLEGSFAAGAERRDEYGRTVYSIDRDSELFGNHILPFLRTNRPGRLCTFAQDPQLWRALREEALFFGLDTLVDFLHVTYSCQPNIRGLGIMYWLGTDKGRRQHHEYANPHAIGAVHVGGWVDMPRKELDRMARALDVQFNVEAFGETSRRSLVQYKPPIKGFIPNQPGGQLNLIWATTPCYSLWCDYSWYRFPVTVDMHPITVRLTHYSLRYDQCGMTHWNFEASQDGTTWDVLHAARDDTHLTSAMEDRERMTYRLQERLNDGFSTTVHEMLEMLHEHVETNHRHTWPIEPELTVFYRYFRLIGLGEHHDGHPCMHGVGLELYGDVHED